MLGGVDQFLFALGMRAPQQKHQMRLMLAGQFDDPVGEMLPALARMGVGSGALHSHGGIEHQHPLVGPALQATVAWNVDVQVALELFIDIQQRRRCRDARLHREAQAMGLARAVIRVLSQDDHFDLVQRRGVEGIEDHRPWRIDLFAGSVFLPQKLAQLCHVGLVELSTQRVLPARFEFDTVVSSHGYIHSFNRANPRKTNRACQLI
ncbi:hypothetical protein D3C84_399530 [compost metagenome]